MQAAVGDSVAPPVLLQALVGAVLLVVIVGGVIVSLRRLDIDLGGGGVPTAALHTFLLFWIVNAADVVVDWLFFIDVVARASFFQVPKGFRATTIIFSTSRAAFFL